MPKFFSNIVFIFGFLFLGALTFSVVQRYWTSEEVDEAALVPPSDLPTLDLGTEAEFHQTLDKLYADGGMERLKFWAESQLVPGRVLQIPGEGSGSPPSQYRLVDRELRSCDKEGLINPDEAPLVARRADLLKLGPRAVQLKWTRSALDEPFTLTTWCLPGSTAK